MLIRCKKCGKEFHSYLREPECPYCKKDVVDDYEARNLFSKKEDMEIKTKEKE